MGKRLTTRAKIARLHSQGFSDSQIANVTGFSKSSVGRIRRGQQSGEKIAAPLNEFFKLGKRARANVVSGTVSLPSARPVAAKRGSKVRAAVEKALISPLMRAEGQLSVFDKDAMVVVQITMKGTGKSRTLFARGGIERREIDGGLRGAITSQYGRQYDGGFDWNDVADITIEEY